MSVVEKKIILKWNTKYIQFMVVVKIVSSGTQCLVCAYHSSVCVDSFLPFSISLISCFYEQVLPKDLQANHLLLKWHWHPRGMHGSSHHFAIGTETACPFFATVTDFVFYRQQFAITFSFSSASLATVIMKEEIKIIKLKKPSSDWSWL